MGKATKWIRALLGITKSKENRGDSASSALKKEKKRWSFAKHARASGEIGIPANEEDPLWLKSYLSDTQQQTKHAIAVAAATAAAADAAVAAAQAAVAVVRLTSQSRGASVFVAGRELRAAVKIQTVFRSHLARKALRALKGLVKLQALVRGFLVRRRAAATLHSMQALFRAQAAVRAQRHRARKCIEGHHDTRGEFPSKRLLTGSYNNNPTIEETPKIVEIDPGRPKSRSRRTNPSSFPEYYDDPSYNPHYIDASSPLPYPTPARLSVPEYQINTEFDWGLLREDYKCPTSQNTPRLSYAFSPAKSLCSESFSKAYLHNPPSYMANTHSFNAKLRSQSAPRQRHEWGLKNRLPLMASRSSFSGVRMHRSCSRVHEDFES